MLFRSNSEDITAVMHEAVHMGILLNGYNIDAEEDFISQAEEWTNKIVKLLKLDKFTK